jgi:hypothetical protein
MTADQPTPLQRPHRNMSELTEGRPSASDHSLKPLGRMCRLAPGGRLSEVTAPAPGAPSGSLRGPSPSQRLRP